VLAAFLDSPSRKKSSQSMNNEGKLHFSSHKGLRIFADTWWKKNNLYFEYYLSKIIWIKILYIHFPYQRFLDDLTKK